MGSTATTCEMCGRPVGDNAYVCRLCTNRTDRHLRTFIDLAGEIEVTVARLARYSDRHGRPSPLESDEEIRATGGLRVTQLPFDPAASTRGRDAERVIVATARQTVSERGGGPLRPQAALGPLCGSQGGCPHGSCPILRRSRYVPSGVVRAAGYLTAQMEWLRHQPQARKVLAELDDAAETIVRLVDSPPPLEYAGPCYTDLPLGGECQEDLYAIKGAPSVRCPACGTRSSMDGRRDWLLREANAVLAHATDIARALTSLGQAVSASKIRNLAARKRITARGADAKGNPLYLVAEVRAVLADMELRALSRAA